jgi:hypothetical protein
MPFQTRSFIPPIHCFPLVPKLNLRGIMSAEATVSIVISEPSESIVNENLDEKTRIKMEEDLMYKMLEEDYKKQQKLAAIEYAKKIKEQEIEQSLKSKGLENIVITNRAKSQIKDLNPFDEISNPNETIKKLLAGSEKTELDDIVFNLPTVKNMRLFDDAICYSHISGYIFAIKSSNILVTIEKGHKKTRREKEEEIALREKLIKMGLQDVIISKHAIERFLQRNEDPAIEKCKNPRGSILKLLAKSFPVKYTSHHVVRLLSNNLIEAKYYYNSGWVMIIANNVMVTMERPVRNEIGKDIIIL